MCGISPKKTEPGLPPLRKHIHIFYIYRHELTRSHARNHHQSSRQVKFLQNSYKLEGEIINGVGIFPKSSPLKGK